MEHNGNRFIVRKGDRILVGLVSPLGTATFIVLGLILRERLAAQSWHEKLVNHVIVEFFFSMALFFILVSLRCLFRPRWLEGLLASTSKKVFLFATIIAAAFVLIFIVDKLGL